MKITEFSCNNCNTTISHFINHYVTSCTCGNMKLRGTEVTFRVVGGHKVMETDIFDEFERVRETLILPIFGGENKGTPLSKLPNSLLEEYLLDPPLEIDFDSYS